MFKIPGQDFANGLTIFCIRDQQNQACSIVGKKMFSDHRFDGIDFGAQKPQFRRKIQKQSGNS
jgi:hypothetical protein